MAYDPNRAGLLRKQQMREQDARMQVADVKTTGRPGTGFISEVPALHQITKSTPVAGKLKSQKRQANNARARRRAHRLLQAMAVHSTD